MDAPGRQEPWTPRKAPRAVLALSALGLLFALVAVNLLYSANETMPHLPDDHATRATEASVGAAFAVVALPLLVLGLFWRPAPLVLGVAGLVLEGWALLSWLAWAQA